MRICEQIDYSENFHKTKSYFRFSSCVTYFMSELELESMFDSWKNVSIHHLLLMLFDEKSECHFICSSLKINKPSDYVLLHLHETKYSISNS